MLVFVIGSYVGFQLIISGVIEKLSERFAIQQVHYDRSRTLYPLLQDIALARKMARTPAIIAFARNEYDPQARANGLAELESFREVFKDGAYFFANAKTGHYYYNDAANSFAGDQLRYTLSPAIASHSWFYATLKNPKECQINVNRDAELSATKVWINCLVRDGRDVIGVTGTGIELANFIRAVLNIQEDGVFNIFIDGDGAIQAHPDIKEIDFHTLTKDESSKKTVYRLITDAESRTKLEKLLHELRAATDKPKTTYLNIDGKRTLVGIAYLPEIDWFNLTILDPRVWVLGGNFTPLIALIIAGMLMTLVFIAMFIHRIVLSRIDRLDRAVRRMRDGNYEVGLADDLGDNRGDEIARLTNSFVELTGMVRRDRAELERKIAERTHELVNARDEAEAANRAKSEFLAMMSHDLRTPLNAIIGFSDMIKSETFGPLNNDRYDSYILDIHQSGHLLLSLINVLLDISKIEAGKMELVETSVDLASFLKGLARHIAPFADGRGVRMEITDLAGMPNLLCDQRSLTQIINNLASNAVKFSNSGQTVVIRTTLNESGELVISVEDQGIGMDAADIEKALEPFAQVRSAEARNQDGTGLGLHVSDLLMRAHGGRLEIKSELGVGTVASAVFPAVRIVTDPIENGSVSAAG